MPQESLDKQPVISKGRAYYAYILLLLLYMFDYIDRRVVVSNFPSLKSDWGLSDMQCGMLVSAVYWSNIIFSETEITDLLSGSAGRFLI